MQVETTANRDAKRGSPCGGDTAPLFGDDHHAGLWSRLKSAYAEQTGTQERALLIVWSSFAVTFGLTRALTMWIHAGHGPKGGGMSVGGRHFHHYNIGIALLGLVGGIALRGRDRHRRHPVTAAAYGSGAALILDEAALLIDLQDVYWARDGRKSVDAAIGVIAAGGVYLAAAPFWNAVTSEIVRSRRRPDKR